MIKHVHWCRSSFAIDDIGSLWLLVAVINAMAVTSFNRPSADSYVLVSVLSRLGIFGTQATETSGDGVASKTRRLVVNYA